jgi:hypothetical protein
LCEKNKLVRRLEHEVCWYLSENSEFNENNFRFEN